jgi:phage-related minor tail protein
MASNRIKGITIEIDGNTTKLQDSLKDVNKTIKDTQNQLKDVDKLLKLDPKNIELLAQKQELLGRQTENVAEKLQKLRDAQQQMKDAGIDTMSDDYMALEREIAECEQEQKKLTEEAKKTDEQIVKVASGFDKVAQKAKKAADATKPLSKAAGAALAGLAGMAVKAGETADEINTLSKQTGIATDTIQKMQYASDLIDVDMETAVKAVAKLKKGLDKNEDTLVSMGVAVRDANGQYRDMESIFMNTVAVLSKIENEVERDKIAMDLFGKSADELAGYIDDGGQAFRELSQQAEQKGLIISDEDLQRANEFNDKLDELKATVGMDLLQAGAQIAEALTPLLKDLAEVITNITSKLSEMNPETVKIVMTILAVVAALSPLLSIVATLAQILPLLTAGALAPMIPVILAVIGVIAALVLIFQTLKQHQDEIKAGLEVLKNFFINVWTAIKDEVTKDIENITKGFEVLKQKFTSLKDTISSIWEAIKAIVGAPLPTPKLKMPHITISGSFSLNPPKAPSFNVKWYKKAMDDAYILNGATIFGQQGGSLLGGGEAGSETIVGTDKLIDMMSQAVGGQTVNVILQGDAAEIFRVVRQENTQFYKANGYSPLTGA